MQNFNDLLNGYTDATKDLSISKLTTASTINKVTITAPATSATLTIADGKTLVISNSLTFTGTDSTSFAFPGSSDTVMTLASIDTITGVKSFNSGKLALNGSSSGTGTLLPPAAASTYAWTLPAATGTLMDLALAQTATNKTFTSPVLTTPVLGTPSSGTLTSCTGLPLTTGVTGTLPEANGGTGVTSMGWTTFTPSISNRGTGTFSTQYARYRYVGSHGFEFKMGITVTADGTGTGTINITIPNSVAAALPVSGSDKYWVARILQYDSSASDYKHLWGFLRADLSTTTIYIGEVANSGDYIGTDFDLNDILYIDASFEI
jgi:hypothetical protein